MVNSLPAPCSRIIPRNHCSFGGFLLPVAVIFKAPPIDHLTDRRCYTIQPPKENHRFSPAAVGNIVVFPAAQIGCAISIPNMSAQRIQSFLAKTVLLWRILWHQSNSAYINECPPDQHGGQSYRHSPPRLSLHKAS